jgi:hypothetical protein
MQVWKPFIRLKGEKNMFNVHISGDYQALHIRDNLQQFLMSKWYIVF